MLWGDQRICKCGMHNFELRLKCRRCGSDKKDSQVAEDSWSEVVDNVILENEINNLFEEVGIKP